MYINRALNIVIDLVRGDGSKIYVHSVPISPEVFDAYYLVISKTFETLYIEGLGRLAGGRVAAKLLRDVARRNGAKALEDVEQGLMNEIKRLAVVIAPGVNGWETVTLHEATTRKVIDAEDFSSVENLLTFFTVLSSMHLREERERILGSALPLWSAQITSSSSTDFMSSLTTLTAGAPTASAPPESAQPSTKAVSSAPF